MSCLSFSFIDVKVEQPYHPLVPLPKLLIHQSPFPKIFIHQSPFPSHHESPVPRLLIPESPIPPFHAAQGWGSYGWTGMGLGYYDVLMGVTWMTWMILYCERTNGRTKINRMRKLRAPLQSFSSSVQSLLFIHKTFHPSQLLQPYWLLQLKRRIIMPLGYQHDWIRQKPFINFIAGLLVEILHIPDYQ